MARAVVVNAAQLASYSQSKQFLLDSGETQSWALSSQLGLGQLRADCHPLLRLPRLLL